MTTKTEMVREFHKAFNLFDDAPWTDNIFRLRWKLISEEIEELAAEASTCRIKAQAGMNINKDDKARLLKEMCDVIYVIAGMAVELGLPLDEAFNMVHESNMSKLDNDGKPVYRGDGKVLKSDNYRPPNLIKLLKDK